MPIALTGRDKADVNALHQESSGMQANYRDASNSRAGGSGQASARKTWLDTPTPIMVPGRARDLNPFDGHRMGDNLYTNKRSKQTSLAGFTSLAPKFTGLSSGGSTSKLNGAPPYDPRGRGKRVSVPGNHTADRTVLGSFPPQKKQKAESHRGSRYFLNDSRTNSGSPNICSPEYEIINVSDEDTGMSVRRRSSPDPLDVIPTRTNLGHIRNHGGHVQSHLKQDGDFQLLSDTAEPFEAANSNIPPRQLPPDGEAKQRLERKHKANATSNHRAPEDIHDLTQDEDPIEDYSDVPSSKQEINVKTGNVQQKIEGFEKLKTRSNPKPPVSLPCIDLNKVPSRSIKGKMRPNTKTNALRDPVATSPSGFTQETGPKKRQYRKAQSPTESINLPLECWAFGVKILHSDTPKDQYWLTVHEGKLSIKLDLQAALLAFKPDEMVKEISLSKFSDTAETFIIEVKTRQPATKGKGISTAHFEQGSRARDGFLVFKFLTKHANWKNGETYKNLAKYLESVVTAKPHILDEPASKSCWEIAENAVEISNALPGFTTPPKIQSADADTASSSSLSPPPEPVVRRSTRQRTSLTRRSSPSPDPDEVILVYPPEGTGRVNITRGDLKRLEPGQYLNDTLIEYGLKLWLNELRENQPKLAEQVYVFSSFFYKKLNVKNEDQGYQSVRKWTSKVDLFSKKYIVVPINEHLHWYLAIICNPEYVLLPPPPDLGPPKTRSALLTRKRKRESDAFESEAFSVHIEEAQPKPQQRSISPRRHKSPEDIVPDSEGEENGESGKAERKDEHEVEELIGLQRSCSISGGPKEGPDIGVFPRPPQADGYISGELLYPEFSEPMDVDMEVDTDLVLTQPEHVEVPERSEDVVARELSPEAPWNATNSAPEVIDSGPIPPSRFYGSASSKRKEKATEPAPIDVDVERDGEAHDEVVDIVEEPGDVGEQRPWVFTFDSLGSTHPKATKVLAGYLQREAKDKKGLVNTTAAKGKQAQVPGQPNYCDCGVYLLHFVKVFMQDPVRYSQLIVQTRRKGHDSVQRSKDWEHDLVAGIRGDLAARTFSLSEEWKKEQEVKDKLKKEVAERQVQFGDGTSVTTTTPTVEDDSDDDIVLEDVSRDPPPETSIKSKGKSRGKAKANDVDNDLAFRFPRGSIA